MVFCRVKLAKNQRSLCLLCKETPRGEGAITLQFSYSELEGSLKKVLGDGTPFPGLYVRILGRGVASKERWGCPGEKLHPLTFSPSLSLLVLQQ